MKSYFGIVFTLFLSASLFVQCSNTANAQLYNPVSIVSGTELTSPIIDGAGQATGLTASSTTFVGTNNFGGILNQTTNWQPVSGTGIDFSLGGVSPTTVSTTTVNKILKEVVYGTWTPSIIGSTSTPTAVTYTVQSGTFRKTGPEVCWTFAMTISAITGGGGNFNISGTPYVVTTAGNRGGGTVTNKSNFITNGPDYFDAINGTHAFQTILDGNTASNAISIANISSTMQLNGQGCYVTTE